MKLLIEFARVYPWSNVVVVLCLLVAGLAEGLGFSSLVPLLNLVTGKRSSGEAAAADGLEGAILGGLERVGLPADTGVLCLLVVGAFALKAGLLLLARRQVGYSAARVVREGRLRLVRALLRTSWTYFNNLRVGSLANSFLTEAHRTATAYVNAAQLVSVVIRIGVYIAVALATSWQVAAVALGIGFAFVVLFRPLVAMGRRAGQRQTLLFTDTVGRLTDVLQGVKPLKAMARERFVAPILEKGTYRLEKVFRKEVMASESLSALTELTIVSILVGGFYLMWVLFQTDLSKLAVLGLLTNRTLLAFGQAQRRYQKTQVNESAYWALLSVIDEAEKRQERPAGGTQPTLERGIELAGVSLAYRDASVFDDLSLTIEPGLITAITGPSGSGKTSLVDLVCGLVEPEKGSVRVDGVPLVELDLMAWRHMLGYVPQEMFLLHDTIEMNVSLGDPAVSRDDVERALRDAHAWEFVSELPDGMDTVVGERGTSFSGGQRQRISIARALVYQPALLILDEATAALDPVSEKAVWKDLQELRGKTTILAISHQPALLEFADRVYNVVGRSAVPIDAAREDGDTLPLPGIA